MCAQSRTEKRIPKVRVVIATMQLEHCSFLCTPVLTKGWDFDHTVMTIILTFWNFMGALILIILHNGWGW